MIIEREVGRWCVRVDEPIAEVLRKLDANHQGFVLGVDDGYFWASLQSSVDFHDDYGQAFVKATVFGVFCALIATYVGFHAKPTPEGTSVATTQSVVYGSLMVLFLDFLLSATLY